MIMTENDYNVITRPNKISEAIDKYVFRRELLFIMKTNVLSDNS